MKKYNKFDLVYESAIKALLKEGSGGELDSDSFSKELNTGTCIRLKPSFFTKSDSSKTLSDQKLEALKELNDKDYDKCKHYFKIDTDRRKYAGPNVKSANDSNSLSDEYGVFSGDPALKDNSNYKFIISSNDIKYIEILNTFDNLPPLLSPKSKYSHHNPEDGRPSPVNDTDFKGLNNSPANRSLPIQNTKL